MGVACAIGGAAVAGATGRAVTGVGTTGAAGGTASAGADCAVAVSGGGGGIADVFVSSVGFAVVTTVGAGFSGLPDSIQAPTPPKTIADALMPIQSNFLEGCRKEVEVSTSIDGARLLDGGTVDVRLDNGGLDCGLACGS